VEYKFYVAEQLGRAKGTRYKAYVYFDDHYLIPFGFLVFELFFDIFFRSFSNSLICFSGLSISGIAPPISRIVCLTFLPISKWVLLVL